MIGALFTLSVQGCRPSLAPLAPQRAPAPVSLCSGPCRDSVEITYLGTSGFLIRHGADAVLTAPSFTHPNLLAIVLPWIPLRSDTSWVERMMSGQNLDGVSSILIGHAHYDHLLDVPATARLAPLARLYGGPTARNIVWPIAALRDRLVALSGADVGDSSRAGTWFPTRDARIRFMPLTNHHAPNFRVFGAIPYTFARGHVGHPRSALPRTARGWRLGEPYSYLIDVLGPDGKPVFRIFYHDAAGEPEQAVLPRLPGDDARPVDVAIICAGNYESARDYPSALLRGMRPRHVIVGHWEDFFRRPSPSYRPIALTNTHQLADRIRATQGDAWVTPVPFARMVYLF